MFREQPASQHGGIQLPQLVVGDQCGVLLGFLELWKVARSFSQKCEKACEFPVLDETHFMN
jgi:hypothetical protein